MNGLVPIVDGVRSQFERMPLERAAAILAEAAERGERWDCRIAAGGQSYRPLDEGEARELVAAIAGRVS